VDLFFFRGGYCGVQPLDSRGEPGSGALTNVCAMVEPSVARNLEEVFRCHPRLARRRENWVARMPPLATAPLTFHEPEPTRGEFIIQVGDAATFVDPFVGDGISLALRSGSLAANCLAGFFSRQCSLDEAVGSYSSLYHRRLSPVYRASSRLRRMLNCPEVVRKPALFLLARTPRLTRRLVEMTRSSFGELPLNEPLGLHGCCRARGRT
jgi:flavin-dependent dehydrogenase